MWVILGALAGSTKEFGRCRQYFINTNWFIWHTRNFLRCSPCWTLMCFRWTPSWPLTGEEIAACVMEKLIEPESGWEAVRNLWNQKCRVKVVCYVCSANRWFWLSSRFWSADLVSVSGCFPKKKRDATGEKIWLLCTKDSVKLSKWSCHSPFDMKSGLLWMLKILILILKRCG